VEGVLSTLIVEFSHSRLVVDSIAEVGIRVQPGILGGDRIALI